MKNLFPHFSDPEEKDYEAIWSDAIFIFDTNVLLNLYRYEYTSRNDLLGTLRKLAGRIWLPFQVALEFQRNRSAVIFERDKVFNAIERIIVDCKNEFPKKLGEVDSIKRHSTVDLSSLLAELDAVVAKFLSTLNHEEQTQRSLVRPDQIKQQLEELFDGKVGREPRNQSDLDAIYKAGEERYLSKTPPGFRDRDKGERLQDEYSNGGLRYKPLYGDYLLWTQILDYAKEESLKSVIFVTDDQKDDWWRVININGRKIIGPRTELLEEAKVIASIENLLFYTPEQFLKYAKQALNVDVSDKTLTDVADVSSSQSLAGAIYSGGTPGFHEVSSAVHAWLPKDFFEVAIRQHPIQPVIATRRGITHEVRVLYNSGQMYSIEMLRDLLSRAAEMLKLRHVDKMFLIWVIDSRAQQSEAVSIASLAARDLFTDGVILGIGACSVNNDARIEYVPYHELDVDEMSNGPDPMARSWYRHNRK